ncbi:two component transcriptional regulator, winged helix family [Clostridium botulinum BKT015925]|nr:two component transcriptional regulator, winged helix family [Clostridium botulinum BKT015925]
MEDEEHIRELIKFNLENNNYKIIFASNGIDAVEIAKKELPDLILLDIMLPGKDGYDVCKEIRNNNDTYNISIIMITAKSEEIDKILGLELGADDYITKPFSIRELIARVKAVLRRTTLLQNNSRMYKFENIMVDFDQHKLFKDNKKVDLTLKEFELIEILVKNKGKIMTREYLLDKVWGYEYVGETRTIDVHIRHLRKKIELDDKRPKFIETIRGVGYRFNCYE